MRIVIPAKLVLVKTGSGNPGPTRYTRAHVAPSPATGPSTKDASSPQNAGKPANQAQGSSGLAWPRLPSELVEGDFTKHEYTSWQIRRNCPSLGGRPPRRPLRLRRLRSRRRRRFGNSVRPKPTAVLDTYKPDATSEATITFTVSDPVDSAAGNDEVIINFSGLRKSTNLPDPLVAPEDAPRAECDHDVVVTVTQGMQ